MPRMKVTTLLLLALSFSSFDKLHNNQLEVNDVHRSEDLTKMVDSIYMPTQFHATFVYKHQQGEEEVHEIAGDIWVKVNKYRLNVEDQIVVSNGTTIWNYILSLQEVQICDDIAPEAEVKMDHFSPIQLLQLYKHRFIPTACDTTIIDHRQCHVICFIPIKQKKSSIKNLQLCIDAHTWQVKSIQLIEADNTIHHFDLMNLTIIDNMPDQDFEFTIPSACQEIIDLR